MGRKKGVLSSIQVTCFSHKCEYLSITRRFHRSADKAETVLWRTERETARKINYH
jgi:hypothetical protein